MEVDWITVGAQIVNFLVLVYLLKRFLYGPIVRNMTLREEKIADRLRQAEEKLVAAGHLGRQYQSKQQLLEEQKSQLLDEAVREADRQRKILLDRVREEIDQRRSTWEAELKKEQVAMAQEIKRAMGEKIIHIARKTLQDLAGVELERRIVQRFLEKLEDLSEQECKELAEAVAAEQDVVVTTSFPIEELRESVVERLRRIQPAVRVKFEQSPKLIFGIVLETSGELWSWSVDSYLDGLEEHFAGALTAADSGRIH